MHEAKRLSILPGLLALIVVFAVGLTVPVTAVGQNTVVPQEIVDKVRDEGRARVIVRLRTERSIRREQGLSRRAVTEQRASIARVQRRIRQRLAGGGNRVRREFKALPYVAMEIDSIGLARLQAAGADVQAVYTDIELRPTLTDSVFQVEGDLAHAAGINGSGAAVVVIDTGAESTHPFLAGKVIHEACFAVNDDGVSGACPNGQPSMIGAGAAAPCDFDPFSCFHGTHVSGIAVGSGPDFTGVAPGADLIPIQVFHPSFDCGILLPSCASAFMSDVAAALEHVYDIRDQYPIASVNLSLGGGYFTADCDLDFPLTKAAIDNLRAAGIATAIASGNGGYVDAMTAPACITSAIAVGAVDELDNIAYFSNSHPLVDLLAPGTNVVSSVPGGDYAAQDGTSMATPHVSGAWAILQQADPTATVDDELTLLQTYGRPVTDTRWEDGVTRSRIRLGPAAGVENPVPVLGAVSPSTIFAWGPNTILTITGSGLARSSAVLADGIPIPTTFVSDTELQATIPANQLLTAATSMDIAVQSPPLGGGTSATTTITLLQPSLTVDVTTVGAGEPITATLTDAPGAFRDALNFTPVGSAETFYVTTTFTPEGQSTATWTINAPYTEGFYEFRFYPGSRGIRAATSQTIEVLPPVPVLSSLTPPRVAADGPDLTVVVNGSYFRSTSRVLVNGVEQPTTFLSTASVSVVVPASAMATSASSLQITAYTPEAGSTQSNALSLEIAHPTLSVSSNDVATGDTVTISVNDSAGNSTDWLALVPAGGADTDYITWAYVPAGAITHDWDVVMPDTPGVYDVRLFENGGFRRLAISEPIAVSATGGGPGANPVLDVSATSVGPGETLSVTLSDGPGNSSDWLALAEVGSPDNTYLRWTYVPGGATTTTWDVAMPDTPGDYEVRLFENGGFTRLATSPTVTVEEAPAGPITIDVSATSVAGGATVTATLSNGPGNTSDWLALAEVGSPDTTYLMWTNVPAGATSATWNITMPATPGDYEIRLYENGGFNRLAASPTVTVEAAPPASPTLDVSAALVNAGDTVTVTLSDGSGNSADWLALASVGDPDNTYLRWTYVPAGATSFDWNVVMPDTPGDYEVRLFENNGFTRLATSPTITVADEPTATPTIDLSATDVMVGEIVTVVLNDGPGNTSDWLALANVGSPDTSYLSWTPIPGGATTTNWAVAMPSTPGDYEIRLFEDGGYTRLATSATITVSEVPPPAATLDVSETLVNTGDTVTVTLSNGPGNSADWLAFAAVGSGDTSYLQWTYVPGGATSTTWNVTMPSTPGDYEVRLFENNGFTRLATSATITVTDATPPPTIDLSATVATTGEVVTVTLSNGPGNSSDWLALAAVGSPDDYYLDYAYVPSGAASSTWNVAMPSTPGAYEIRLFENGGFSKLATSGAIAVNP